MRLKIWIGIALSIGLLVFLFSRMDMGRLLAAIRSADPLYLALSAALVPAFFWVRALRWRYLVIPVKQDVPTASLFSATMIGFMANNVLPARLGEFVRAYVLGRREEVSKSSVFATIVVERLFDGLAVLLLLLLTLVLLPPEIADGGVASTIRGVGEISLAGYAGVIIFLGYFLKRPDLPRRGISAVLNPVSPRLAEKAAGLADSFMHGLGVVKSPRLLAIIVVYTAVHWGLMWVPVWLIYKAFGLGFGVYESLFLLVVTCLSVALPSTPGFVGTFHAAATGGLILLGMDKEPALAVAIVAHAANFVPVTLLGLYYMSRESITFKSIRSVEAKA